jgi:hypothetical protein
VYLKKILLTSEEVSDSGNDDDQHEQKRQKVLHTDDRTVNARQVTHRSLLWTRTPEVLKKFPASGRETGFFGVAQREWLLVSLPNHSRRPIDASSFQSVTVHRDFLVRCPDFCFDFFRPNFGEERRSRDDE